MKIKPIHILTCFAFLGASSHTTKSRPAVHLLGVVPVSPLRSMLFSQSASALLIVSKSSEKDINVGKLIESQFYNMVILNGVFNLLNTRATDVTLLVTAFMYPRNCKSQNLGVGV